ncbi:porin-like protein [Mesorhizobium sp. J18]|uniref:porin n=1 Tax=Mesorhizobium sp. J18 TaxID=935263 RepID=UPI001198CD11|nr:porin [Mesorhizobium sp. J18]TWG99363.1 porin-like protein [Mesorhizobium sp. J18]
MKIARALALPLGALVLGGPAFAADAIVIPEPEPMEYVRVCDVYGAGFFYIPGTETCLQISGYVRYIVGATSDDGDADETGNWYGFEPDEYNKQIRARINFDARSETEWGTLRAYIRLQASEGPITPNDDPDVGLDLAFIQLGGFAVGYMQSAFAGTFNGGDSNDGTHSDDGLDYGDSYRTAVQYNFGTGEGFFATISLESDDYHGDLVDGHEENYIPDVVGKVGYAANWGTIHGLVGYDESLDTFAARAGIHLNIPSIQDASLKVNAFYSDDYNVYWDTSEWSVQASYGQAVTETVFASLGGQYWSEVRDLPSGTDMFSVEGSLVWEPVQNFDIRTEVNYIKADGLDGSLGGYMWFRRSF